MNRERPRGKDRDLMKTVAASIVGYPALGMTALVLEFAQLENEPE